MKILVAGGSGFIGTNLLQRLLPLDAKITATWYNTLPKVIHKNIEYVRCDLTDKNDCRNIAKDMDFVVFCASFSHGAAAMAKDPMSFLTPNILMPCNVLDAAYHANVKKTVFLSSSTAYPPSSLPVTEDMMWNKDPYEKYYIIGWHKRISEKICQIYSEKADPPMPVAVLRLTNVYGPYDDFEPETSHVLPALIRKVVEKQDPLEVWGDGNDIRDLIYVDDVVDAILLALEKLNSFNPINIGFGETYSVKEMLQIVLGLEQFKPIIIFNLLKPTMIPERYVDVHKAKEVLGFVAKTPLVSGITKTIKWYRNEQKNC